MNYINLGFKAGMILILMHSVFFGDSGEAIQLFLVLVPLLLFGIEYELMFKPKVNIVINNKQEDVND